MFVPDYNMFNLEQFKVEICVLSYTPAVTATLLR